MICLPHLFGLVLAELQYKEKSHIDVLLGAVVYARVVEGAFIEDNLNAPLATPSVLGRLLSGKTPSITSYRATNISSSHTVQNCCTGKFLQIYFLHVLTTVDPL